MSQPIPDKPYFKIGEVSRIAGVKAHVLRYWESEFKALRPEKTASNQRVYRRRDVELVQQIKRLLHEEGYTIAGANRRLEQLGRQDRAEDADRRQTLAVLRRVRREVRELVRLLDEDRAPAATERDDGRTSKRGPTIP